MWKSIVHAVEMGVYSMCPGTDQIYYTIVINTISNLFYSLINSERYYNLFDCHYNSTYITNSKLFLVRRYHNFGNT